MSVVCARCGRIIRSAVFFCRRCRVHYGWECTSNGNCRRCGESVIRMS